MQNTKTETKATDNKDDASGLENSDVKSGFLNYKRPLEIYPIRHCFSYRGRVQRLEYWLKGILPVSAFIFFVAVVFMKTDHQEFMKQGAINLTLCAFLVPALYPCVAAIIKRCHDRNRSAWFALLFLLPPLTLWCFIDLGFMRGSPGPNYYGLPARSRI